MILKKLYQKYFDKKIPLMVSFEVTKRCVNNCIHCYLAETHQKKIFEEELTFNEIKKTLDELKELGTVFLNITGGEPVLRKDIEKIIKKAIKNNFYVKLFSSLNFDLKIFQKLYSIGLREIDVSLYGRKEIHNKVCRNDSFDRVLNNIKDLKKMGFKINIKTPLMNININEINWIYKFSKENDLNFILDPVITPLNDGSDFTLKYSVDFNDAFDKIKFIDLPKEKCIRDETNNNYSCGALRTTIGIDSYGRVFPCLAFPFEIGNIRERSLKDILYSDYSENLRNIIEKEPEKCRLCDYKNFCSRCVGVSWVYKKDFDYIYEPFCKIAKRICKEVKSPSYLPL